MSFYKERPIAASGGVKRSADRASLSGSAVQTLRELFHAGAVLVNQSLELDGRHFRILGFDPTGVSDRRVYLEEAERRTVLAIRIGSEPRR